MSLSSTNDGDSSAVMVGADLDHPAGGAMPGTHAGPRRDPVVVRLPEELDYRLRGLRAEPPDHVPATPAPTDQGQRRRGRRRHGPLLAKVAVFLVVAAVGALLLQDFVVRPFAVPGDAMASTIQAGDRILVVKPGLLEGPIRSGQIVVFHPPRSLACTVVGGSGGDLVLRVVALPGETIRSARGTIAVDGRPLRERGWYDPRFGQLGSAPIPSTTLAKDQYFVMGDNRSDACDSRVFGPISKSSIVGIGVAIVVRHGHAYFRAL